MESASTAQTPRALVLLLQDLITELYPNSTLIVVPQRDYNYSIKDIRPLLKDTVENLFPPSEVDELLKPFSEPLNLISFPRIERDNILNHAIFGHELGHPIADEFLSLEESCCSSYQSALDHVTAEVRGLIQSRIAKKSSLDTLKLAKPYVESLLQIRRRGLEELISDCVSLLLFGPSALFAAYDILLGTQLDAEPDGPEYYPPPRYRLRVLKDLLDKESYTSALMHISPPKQLKALKPKLEEFFRNLHELTDPTPDVVRLEQQPVTALAYGWLNKVLPQAIDFAKESVEKLIYSPKQMSDDINVLIQRLALGIPSNEIGAYPNTTTVDWRSSIVAGWVYKIAGLSLPYTKGENFSVEHIDRLNRLTMRAVESGILARQYSTLKKMEDQR